MDKLPEQKPIWDSIWNKPTEAKVNSLAKKCCESISRGHSSKSVLELGCGYGQDSVYFADKGHKVTAIDFSTHIGNPQLKSHPNIKFINQNILDINFDDDTFDVVYSHLGLHYFNDKETSMIFNKILKVLKPGGLFFVKCKSTGDPLFGLGTQVEYDSYLYFDHFRHFFSKSYMISKLTNFQIQKVRQTSSIYKGYKSSFVEAIAQKEKIKNKT